MRGKAGIGFLSFCFVKNKKPTKRPIKEKRATINDFEIPRGIKEEQKIKGNATSPPPKIKNFPPTRSAGTRIFSKLSRKPKIFEGITRAKIARLSIISFAIFTICFVL